VQDARVTEHSWCDDVLYGAKDYVYAMLQVQTFRLARDCKGSDGYDYYPHQTHCECTPVSIGIASTENQGLLCIAMEGTQPTLGHSRYLQRDSELLDHATLL
jgi:hypothetical protein